MTEQTQGPAEVERQSTPGAAGPEGAAGDMGSSSERVGHTGPGQIGADGLRDTSRLETPEDGPPEQRPGADEVQPEGLEPKAGYPSLDPRHEHKPYHG